MGMVACVCVCVCVCVEKSVVSRKKEMEKRMEMCVCVCDSMCVEAERR